MAKCISIIAVSLSLCLSVIVSAQGFQPIQIDSEITDVQPMTGIVLWPGNSCVTTDAVALEYSYMSYADIVTDTCQYDWTSVDSLLDAMASRNHQGILRFNYVYPGEQTNVPQYIKDLPDYMETLGTTEGLPTWFPDWTHPELKSMMLKFYAEFASRYDDDPRLAFLQTGFGLWAEYHIYDGPFILGQTFPSKACQKDFFNHMDTIFNETYWSISIDAASDTYSPFVQQPACLDIDFGLFDDSFMHENHSGYNESSWNFFDRNRYLEAPAGGEFSYYSSYDQQNVLNPDYGAYCTPYEIYAQDFHITYMIGNDQPAYQTKERIKEASLASGYKFKLVSVQSMPDSTIVEIVNVGVAPIYVDAYLTVNGVMSTQSLKLLPPGQVTTFHIPAGSYNPVITIESDDILATEEIQYYGTVNEYDPYVMPEIDSCHSISISRN